MSDLTINAATLKAFVAWGLSHAGDVPKLVPLLTNLTAAGSIADAWTDLKAIGDLVVPWTADLPSINAPLSAALDSIAEQPGLSLDDVHAKLAASGLNIQNLITTLTGLVPAISALIQAIGALINKPQPTQQTIVKMLAGLVKHELAKAA